MDYYEETISKPEKEWKANMMIDIENNTRKIRKRSRHWKLRKQCIIKKIIWKKNEQKFESYKRKKKIIIIIIESKW